jgi:hypothetical protein
VFEVVGDLAHHETVEQCRPMSGAGKDASAGQEAKILQ